MTGHPTACICVTCERLRLLARATAGDTHEGTHMRRETEAALLALSRTQAVVLDKLRAEFPAGEVVRVPCAGTGGMTAAVVGVRIGAGGEPQVTVTLRSGPTRGQQRDYSPRHVQVLLSEMGVLA